MDSLDNMFIPYKDVLYPKESIVKTTSSSSKNWLWMFALMFVGGALAYFFFFSGKTKTFELPSFFQETTPNLTTHNLNSVINNPPVTPSVIPTFKEIPTLKEIPKTISLIRGGQKEIYNSPTEFARHVGTAVKETLLTFPQMNAPLVASIVQCAVKSVLNSQKPSEKVPEKPIELPKKAVEIFKANDPILPEPPKEGKLSVANLPLPFIDEDEETSNDSGKKQGKINAESNPFIMQMIKERGLDKKSTE